MTDDGGIPPRTRVQPAQRESEVREERKVIAWSASATFAAIWVAVLALAVWSSLSKPLEAKLFPVIAGGVGLALGVGQLVTDALRARRGETGTVEATILDVTAEHDHPAATVARRASVIAGWILALAVAIWLVGLLISSLAFCFLYLMVQARTRWWVATLYASATMAVIVVVFHYALRLPWPAGIFEGPERVVLDWLG